jgi:hypothetical protein
VQSPGGAKGLILAYTMSFVLTTVASALAFCGYEVAPYFFFAASAGFYLRGLTLHLSLPFEDK